MAQSTRTHPKLHPAGYLENRSVKPAYILEISLSLGDLDRHPGFDLFGDNAAAKTASVAADLRRLFRKVLKKVHQSLAIVRNTLAHSLERFVPNSLWWAALPTPEASVQSNPISQQVGLITP